MDFGGALSLLNADKAVRRKGWRSRGMFIVKMPPLKLPGFNQQPPERKANDRVAKWIGYDTPLDCLPYVAMHTAAGQWQPGWVCGQADMFADDWEESPPLKA